MNQPEPRCGHNHTLYAHSAGGQAAGAGDDQRLHDKRKEAYLNSLNSDRTTMNQVRYIYD
jgi:hypothetical protein